MTRKMEWCYFYNRSILIKLDNRTNTTFYLNLFNKINYYSDDLSDGNDEANNKLLE